MNESISDGLPTRERKEPVTTNPSVETDVNTIQLAQEALGKLVAPETVESQQIDDQQYSI